MLTIPDCGAVPRPPPPSQRDGREARRLDGRPRARLGAREGLSPPPAR
jgi:hypothetical protein